MVFFWWGDTYGLNLVKETSKSDMFSRIFKAVTPMSEDHFFTRHNSQYLYAITFSFVATQYKFAVDTVALSNTEITVPLK